ncbi:hypothetical protein DOTSEDRAFT_21415 [Dothistroma septosporum NZE10]|uniref:Uncharacterized protein n=1 Tax=Dothistroma septosporum (strain NZE10 / CBS 128990) TaxID=675120 RepID=N1PVZ5_DOTSN|nr:hypothetical protein DOTSEDRAFT_21415 [Dothistroma septosporum NZE10]
MSTPRKTFNRLSKWTRRLNALKSGEMGNGEEPSAKRSQSEVDAGTESKRKKSMRSDGASVQYEMFYKHWEGERVEKDKKLIMKERQVRQKDEEIRQKDEEIRQKDIEIHGLKDQQSREADRRDREKDRKIEELERALRKLPSKQQITPHGMSINNLHQEQNSKTCSRSTSSAFQNFPPSEHVATEGPPRGRILKEFIFGQFIFGDMPAEIRNMIYKEVLTGHGPIKLGRVDVDTTNMNDEQTRAWSHGKVKAVNPPAASNITRCSKLTMREGSAFLYDANTFILLNLDVTFAAKEMKMFKFIKHIELPFLGNKDFHATLNRLHRVGSQLRTVSLNAGNFVAANMEALVNQNDPKIPTLSATVAKAPQDADMRVTKMAEGALSLLARLKRQKGGVSGAEILDVIKFKKCEEAWKQEIFDDYIESNFRQRLAASLGILVDPELQWPGKTPDTHYVTIPRSGTSSADS